jgi:predicted RNA-binding Zn ribbon-like protein
MRLSQRYPIPVPPEFALLYEFVNSLDLRCFVHHGEPHVGGDELATVPKLELWMRCRGLLDDGVQLGREEHRNALELRNSLRALLLVAPPDRLIDGKLTALLNASTARFPLILQVSKPGKLELQPLPGVTAGGLGSILAELQGAAASGRLDRLKMCDSEECHWVFYDRSKPGARRWCASALCGNRQKTRAYRLRQRAASLDEAQSKHQ